MTTFSWFYRGLDHLRRRPFFVSRSEIALVHRVHTEKAAIANRHPDSGKPPVMHIKSNAGDLAATVRPRLSAVLGLWLLAPSACGDIEGRSIDAGVGGIHVPASDTSDISDTSAEDTTAGAGGDTGADFPDVGTPGPDVDSGPDSHDECASTVIPAENDKQQADIIVVIDNSGSMDVEAQAVQDNLNAFSQQIIGSGIDVRVVMISGYIEFGSNGVCIDPPLGSCNGLDDNNPPLYTHIEEVVNSNNALIKVLEYEPEWRDIVRPNSALHIVVVSDDEAAIGGDAFNDQLTALSPDYADYRLSGIVCLTPCEEAAAVGHVYIGLSALTGGTLGDLCLQDFQPVFDQLAASVITTAQIACNWDIPSLPDPDDFDPEQVNVEFSDGVGGGFTIGRVDSVDDCIDVDHGWYYDDPITPAQIITCPQTCQSIQGVETAEISIALGCASEPAG